MKLPKRVELWLLLAAIVAGLLFVFASRHPAEEVSGAGGSGPDSLEDLPLKLHRCVLERDGGNARLDIELRVQNALGEKLVFQSPKVRLLTAKGREIPGFYLPFDPLPEVPAKTTEDVQLRYWLEAADLRDGLMLVVDGGNIEVKSSKTFDLDTLKNAENKTFISGAW